MRLAWRNLLHDRTRLAVTVVGIAFAVFLMIFEGSLLAGFLEASSEVIDSVEGDLWVTARDVPCFDFPSPLPERFRNLAMAVPGVAEVHRIATGMSSWQKPGGGRQMVIIIGADPGVGAGLPRPRLIGASGPDSPEAVVIDASDLSALGLDTVPASVQIGSHRSRVIEATTGFASFLGSPYVFTTYSEAVRYAGLGPEETTFLVVRIAPGYDVEEVRGALQSRLPETDVRTRDEFSTRSRRYWVLQTGAGGAIMTAGFLGFVVGVVIVSQTIYAMTMENIEEYATLRAMGASRGFISRVVLAQGAGSGLLGYLLGVGVCLPALAFLRGGIPWVTTPPWLPAGMFLVSMLMCGLASLVSIRKAISVEPARVFRA